MKQSENDLVFIAANLLNSGTISGKTFYFDIVLKEHSNKTKRQERTEEEKWPSVWKKCVA